MDDKNKVKSAQAHKNEEGKVHVAGLKGGQRVKMVDAEVAPVETAPEVSTGTKSKKIVERVRGKKYQKAKTSFDHEKYYTLKEAVKLAKSSSYSKFDGTMELHLIVKKAGTSAQVTLPFQAGKTKKVEIADENTLEKLKKGIVDYDVLVATSAFMPRLVPFARVLGPKGLMPNPKNGTLVADEKKAKAYSASAILVKTEKEAPLVHTVIGKVSQEDAEVVANAEAILKALGGAKQIVKAFVKSSMSPSVKLQLS